MTIETWKLQRPLFTTGDAEVLAYTKARPRDYLLPPTSDLLAFFGREYKIYAECSMVGGKLTVHKVLRDRVPRW